MASLKDLKSRIGSVKNTQKITRAMKMVAAAKLRRAKESAESARPYAEAMERVLQSVATNTDADATLPTLLSGTGKRQTYLLIVATADRGLCGGFNTSIVKSAKHYVAELEAEGKKALVLCLGKKGIEQLQMQHNELIVERLQGLYKTEPAYEHAREVAQTVERLIDTYDVDVCQLVYSKFQSAISQTVTWQQLMPMDVGDDPLGHVLGPTSAQYEFEPSEEKILADLVPRNLTVQLYRAMLENVASEQGARMTAMDNATRNAGEMITDLTLQYNRSRQAAITKELIEIISGAEALS